MTANGYTGAEVSIDDVSGLAEALAATATVPITMSEVTGLIAALAGKLSTLGGTVAGNLVVQDANGTKSYGFRSNGSNLDLEGAGADIFVSVWSGAGNTGAQRNYLRLESGSALAHAVGPWVWETAPFGAEVHRIDPVTGVATFASLSSPTLAAAVRPSDHALVGWTFDPTSAQGGTVLAPAGTSHVIRFRAMSTTITNLLIHLTAGGTTLTAGQCFATLHTDAGVQIGATADQAANWASGGLKTMALAAPATGLTVGAWYKARLWFNGTTGPTLTRGLNSSTAILNAGLSSPNFRYATADTGLTTLALAPTTLGTPTGGATAWWVGAS